MKTLLGIFFVCIALGILSCGIVKPEYDDTMLDGNVVIDTAAMFAHTALVSSYAPNPTPAQQQVPVLIAAHGFTATTYEWLDFRNYVDSINAKNNDTAMLVSQVLLGGHGKSYDAFKKSTWNEWQTPIMEEYNKLVALGYNNISLAGSSTGGALVLELIGSGAFTGKSVQPQEVFMVDAIVLPSSKLLTLIDIVGPIMGNSISKGNEVEKNYWYANRPAEALSELMDIINETRYLLEEGISLPIGSDLSIFKSKKDGSADPVSALLIYKGVRTSEGKYIDENNIHLMDSDTHVFTRLNGRDAGSVSEKDIANQKEAFVYM